MKSATLIPTTILLSIIGLPTSASGVCLDPDPRWDWTGFGEIKVYANEYLDENLEFPTGPDWSSADVSREIQSMLMALSIHLPANHPPLRYMGITRADWDQILGPGTVHIAPWLDNSEGCNAMGDQSGQPSSGVLIRLKRSGTGWNGADMGLDDCGISWTRHVSPGGSELNFRGVTNHELMHAFGNQHNPFCDGHGGHIPCNDVPCSCGSAPFTGKEWNCYVHDWNVLTYHNGTFPKHGPLHEESFDGGLNWYSLASAIDMAPGFGLSTSPEQAFMFAGIREPGGLQPHLWRWVSTTDTWQDWGRAVTTQTIGYVDAAYKSTRDAALAWTIGAEADDPRSSFLLTLYGGPGNPVHWQWGANLTRTPGASVAYEERYGWWIIAWRDTDRQIYLSAFKNGVFKGPVKITDGASHQKAAEAPSVACGGSEIPQNCLLVWASTSEGESYRSLRWVHFNVNSLGYPDNFGNLMSQGILLYGAPDVSYAGPPGSPSAYMLSFAYPESTHYTMPKGAGSTEFWDTGNAVPHFLSPDTSLGTAIGSVAGYYELLGMFKP